MLSRKPWRPELVLLFGAAMFSAIFFTAIISLLLQKSGLPGFRRADDFGFLLLGTLGIQGAAWIFIFPFLKLHQVKVLDAFGFRGPYLGKSILLALATVIVSLMVAAILQYLCVSGLEKIGWPVENQRAIELLINAKSFWFRTYLGFFAVVIAPVAEEFIFRGVLYPFVKQLGSPRTAFFGVSAIFALIHFDLGTLVPLFALALALTWLYEKTDNLLAPITAHSLFNGTNLVALHFREPLENWLQKLSHHA